MLSDMHPVNVGGKLEMMRVRATDPRPCPKCGKIYRSAHTLRTHMEDKHTICPGYRCVLCGTVAKSRNSLHSHMSRQHRGISTKDLPVVPMPAPFDPELASKLLSKAGVKENIFKIGWIIQNRASLHQKSIFCMIQFLTSYFEYGLIRSHQQSWLLEPLPQLPVEVTSPSWITILQCTTRTNFHFLLPCLLHTWTFQTTGTEIGTRTAMMIQKIWESPCHPLYHHQTFHPPITLLTPHIQ